MKWILLVSIISYSSSVVVWFIVFHTDSGVWTFDPQWLTLFANVMWPCWVCSGSRLWEFIAWPLFPFAPSTSVMLLLPDPAACFHVSRCGPVSPSIPPPSVSSTWSCCILTATKNNSYSSIHLLKTLSPYTLERNVNKKGGHWRCSEITHSCSELLPNVTGVQIARETFEQRDDHRNLPVVIQGHFLTREERWDSLGSAERHWFHSSPLLPRPCPQPSSLPNLRLNTPTSSYLTTAVLMLEGPRP